MTMSSAKSLDLHMLELNLEKLSSGKKGAEIFMTQELRLDLLITSARNLQLLPKHTLGHDIRVCQQTLRTTDRNIVVNQSPHPVPAN